MPSSQIKLSICHVLDIVRFKFILADWEGRRQHHETRTAVFIFPSKARLTAAGQRPRGQITGQNRSYDSTQSLR